MLFSKRHYLGIDISATSLQAVSLERSGKEVRTTAARSRSLTEGMVKPQLRNLNLAQPAELISSLRDLLDPLSGGEERIALSLPDMSGCRFLHDLETSFKSRDEALEILRWQLKNSLPAPPREVQLDFQLLSKNDQGRSRLLVSVMAKKVLEQYEELLNGAGYHPVVVDFHSLNVLGFYYPQLDFNDDLVVIMVDGPTLVFLLFQNGQLVMQRCREVGEQVERVFQEINRSVSGSQEKQHSLGRARVVLHSDWERPEPLQEAISAVLEKPVQLLETRLEKLFDGPAPITPRQGRSLAAAYGAAARLM